MIAVRRAGRDDIDAVREVGLKTWPAAYAGIASPEFIVDGLAQMVVRRGGRARDRQRHHADR